jgi:hypothetical protein
MSDAPSVRAGFMRMFLAAVDELPAADAVRIRGLVTAEHLRAVEEAPLVGWVPAAANFAMTAAVVEVLGMDGAKTFFRGLFRQVWKAPFFRAVVEGVARLMGADPGAYFKHLPRSYPILFRGFGVWEPRERAPNHATFEIIDVIAPCFAADARWIRCAAASIETVYELAGRSGTSELLEIDPVRGRITVRFSWT